MNLPKLADQLLPFLLPALQPPVTGGAAAQTIAQHELNGSLHVGMLSDAQAPQFLKTDGSRELTGNLTVASGVTIDGVDISAHALNPAAHHPPVTAGAGVSVSGQQISVGAGTMIAVGTATVGISPGSSYQFIGTGSGTTAAWRNVSELAGGGLAASNGVLAVGVANTGAVGLSVEADAVRLTSSSNPGAAAMVLASDVSGGLTLVQLTGTTRVRTPLIDTAAGVTMTISPSLDLVLNPGGGRVMLGSGDAIQSSSYASQTTGWRITDTGEADFRYLFVDEMHAKTFVADLEQALAGGQIISKSVAVLAAAFAAPAAGGTATLRVRDLPSAANMAVFQSGDIVRLRKFSRAGGNLTIADCWGTVTGYADQPDGTQTWTFTRSTSPNAGAMTAGTVIEPDALVLDYGTSGGGFYEVNAIDGAYGLNSPYAQVVSWTSHPATGQAVRARLGNLRGVFGVSNEYGLYAGAGTSINDAHLRISNTGVGLYNLPLRMYSGGTERVHIASHNDVWIGPSSADKRLSWDGSTLTVTGTINVLGGNAAKTDLSNSTISTLISGSSIRVGSGTKDINLNGWNIDNTEIVGQSAGVDQVVMNTSGRLIAGAGTVALDRYGYLIAQNNTNGGGTWPFYDGGLHVVASINNPSTSYRGSLAYGLPMGVWATIPSSWYFKYPGVLPQTIPVEGGPSLDTALMISDDNGSYRVWHSGNVGHGSSLDADTVDGHHASSFIGGWTAVTLNTPWQNWGSGWATAAYSVFGNWVVLKGLIKVTEPVDVYSVIFWLPTAARPSENRRLSTTIAPNVAVGLDVRSTGVVALTAALDANTPVSIECVFMK